jgi:predicted nuclease with TOPRIM domain
MKTGIAMLMGGVFLQAAQITTYGGWLTAFIVGGFYVKLLMSDPYRSLNRAVEKVRELTHAAEELKTENLALRNRNDQLSTDLQSLHAECTELRSNFKLLKVAFDKNGETIARLAEDLKDERELRDQQFMQWTREKAARGEL